MLEQDYPSEAFEVVLIDDGSSDGTVDWARSLKPSCHLEVLSHEHRGPAFARNVGIRAARGELLLFLDDDILCDRRLLEEHVAAHRDAPGGLVHGRISLANGSPDGFASRGATAWYEGRHAAIVERGGLHVDRDIFLNANTSYPAPVMFGLGGFDEQIPFPREDLELGLRVVKSGIPIRYRSQARAYELVDESSTARVRGARARGVADVIICRKHPDYRPYAALAYSDPPHLVKASARMVFHRLPVSVASGLNPVVALTERHIRRSRSRGIGSRLLTMQRQMVFDRAASRQAGSAARLEAEFGRCLPVLMYHRVGAPVSGLYPDLTVSPDVFARQLRWLRRRGYTAISPGDWFDWRCGRADLPHKPVLITFDDAYADLADHALPILRASKFTATIFVVTQRVGAFSDWNPVRLPIMTADKIAEWNVSGFAFGAHGRTHRKLPQLSDADLRDEIIGSRDDLEQIVGHTVRAFAYPFGCHNEMARAIVGSSYDVAFLAEGPVNVLTTPPHLLRRAHIGPHDSGLQLEWRAWTGDVPLHKVRDRLRIASRFSAARVALRRA